MKGIVHMDPLEPGLGSHSAAPKALTLCHIGFCLLRDRGNSGSWRLLPTGESMSPAAPWISLFPLLASS